MRSPSLALVLLLTTWAVMAWLKKWTAPTSP